MAGLAWCLWPTLLLAEPTVAPVLPQPVLTALATAGVPASAVSMMVVPVEAGAAPRLAHEAATPRSMASVMKLFTTGVALQTLGPTYTWRTDAALGGPLKANGQLDGPLYLRGSGDPALVMESVWLMMSRWRGAGLRHIKGDLIVDRTAFQVPPIDPAAFDGQALKPYNAGPDALLLNHQAVSLRFTPDAARPGQVIVSLEPALDGVRLEARLQPQAAAPCGDWREALTLRMSPAAGWPRHDLRPWTLLVQGPYPLACGSRDWPLLWQGDGPGDLAARLLSATWKQVGGKLGADIQAGTWPATATVWQSWTSPPLAQVVRDINKFSNNVMARQLFLTLGRTNGEAASLDPARQAVSKQVQAATRDGAGRSPCEGEALVMDNGSGLSRTERSTAACLARWLQTMWSMPVMPEFIASLPIAGQDGTAKRLVSVSGRAHLKTGSLDGVAALAGYVDGDSGRRYVVVGTINHAQADAARPALQALLAWAARDQN
jgi:D-alanyl-D-alanine carboxypeptidase/D-alanyl-D-alanine-endopeptidase (penicillin-binding protein 4)